MASQTTQWILELIDKVTTPMREISGVSETVRGKTDKVGESLKKMSAIDLYAVSSSVSELSNMLNQASAPGIAFDSQMHEVEAITGLTGKALDDLGDSARDTAKEFGGDASAMMESYKSILSRLGPGIAENQEALNAMGTDVATLSKTMGNDAVGAMDALTTSVLQFGVDLSDPQHAANEMNRMMHVMAAGAKEGAAEVPSISQALKQAGVQALNSNVSFEETNAALQALAKGGKQGSEAGVALRNVLGKMAGLDVVPKAAQAKLQALGVNYDIVSDKTRPLAERFRELSKAQSDGTILAQVFGVENAAAAEILLRSADYQSDLAEKITGTNVATEQANIVMGSYSERIARTKAWFSDLGISIFGATQHILPFVDGMSGAVMVMANMANARKGFVALFSTLKTMPVVAGVVNAGFGIIGTGAKMLGVAIMNIPIIGWIAAIIAALIALGTYFWNTSAEFRGVLLGVWESVKTIFNGMALFIGQVLSGVWDLLKGVFNPVNWFSDDYSFSDGLNKITNAAANYGESIGKAFQEGKQKGLDSYAADHPNEHPAPTKAPAESSVQSSSDFFGLLNKVNFTNTAVEVSGKEATPERASTNLEVGASHVVTSVDLGDLKKRARTDTSPALSSRRSANGGRSISQKIDIKNYFNVGNGTDVDAIAEKIIGTINRKLRDAVVAV